MVNPRQKWSELMNLRRPIYESLADLTIDVSEKSVNEISAEIIGAL